jgi:pimeloyl-ACP methyl ester carboxylesterase
MNRPSSFVLVHGAWHGGWCWDRVRPFLEAANARIVTPTLSGLAEKAAKSASAPVLPDHINDVIAAVEDEQLNEVVLVGHSYAGMLITAAAEKLRSRLKHLVYVDAAVPGDGDDFASQFPGLSAQDIEKRRAAFRALAPDGVWLPAPPPQMVGVTKPEDVAWLAGKLTPHPLSTWLEPVHLRNGGHQDIKKTFVVATSAPTVMMGYPIHAERAKAGGEWSCVEMATGHDMMVTEPEKLAAVLLSAAA